MNVCAGSAPKAWVSEQNANITGAQLWQAMPGTEIDFTLAHDRPVVFMADGVVASNAAPITCEFRVVVDDIAQGDHQYGNRRFQPEIRGEWNWSFRHMMALTAGAHTARLDFQGTGCSHSSAEFYRAKLMVLAL